MSAHRRSNMVVKRKREPPPREHTFETHFSNPPPAHTAGAGKGANKLISHLCSL